MTIESTLGIQKRHSQSAAGNGMEKNRSFVWIENSFFYK